MNQSSSYEDGNSNTALNTNNLLWAYCIESIQSVHSVTNKLRMRGTDMQQQVKQAGERSVRSPDQQEDHQAL